MQTPTEIWKKNWNRLCEIGPQASKAQFMGHELDADLVAELTDLRQFFDSNIDPEILAIQMTGIMALDLEKLVKIGNDLSKVLVEMRQLKIAIQVSEMEGDEESLEELDQEFDNKCEVYENLRLYQLNFQEKFLMTYDQTNKFYGK